MTGVTETFRDVDGKRRIECWTDGTWVKLGKDVENDQCIEFRIEHFETVEGHLRYFDGGATQFQLKAEYGGEERYVVYDSHRPRVVRDDEIVLLLGDDGYPLYQTRSLVLDERADFEPEDIARNYTEALAPYDEITKCTAGGTSTNVHVKLFSDHSRVNLRFIEELQTDEAIKSESVEVFAENGGVQYDFVVVTDNIPGDCTATAE